MLRCGRLALGCAVLFTPFHYASAQLDPGANWRTITTPHFRVHYTPATERLARRAAVEGERAYALLAAELKPPRGPVDVVVSDDVDFSNGYATTYPTNRIVIYAHPPSAEVALRFVDDWISLVLTHELVHIFHLDRSRGLWRIGQALFGRNPTLFPNQYVPRWITEGIAVHYESQLTGAGRLAGTTHRMVARTGLLEHGSFARLDELSLATSRYPYGQAAYIYGSLLMDHLAHLSGPGGGGMRRFIDATAAMPIPFLLEPSARRAFGVTLQKAWTQWRDSTRRALVPGGTPMEGWRELRSAREHAEQPRWIDDTTLALVINDGRTVPALVRIMPDGEQRLARRNTTDANAPVPGGGFVFAQLDYTSPYALRSDLWRSDGEGERRITKGARLSRPDVRHDGLIVAVQAVPGATRLVTVAPDGAAITPLTNGTPDTTWVEPRWSPDGTRVAASRWRRGGYSAIVVIDVASSATTVIHESRAVNAAPAWTRDGASIVFSSDRTDIAQLYRVSAREGAALEPLSRSVTGLFEPQVSPDGRRIAALAYHANGYSLGVAPLARAIGADTTGRIAQTSRVAAPDSLVQASSRFRSLRTLLPHYWMPSGSTLGDGRRLIGGLTSASDVVGRRSWFANALFDTREHRWEGNAHLRYAGLRQPVLDLGLEQSHDYLGVVFPGDTARRGIRRTSRIASTSATLTRPRIRTNTGVSFGGSVEWQRYHENNPRLEGRLASVLGTTPVARTFPSAFVTGFFANPRRPARAISLEDGISLTATARQRWLPGGAGLSRSLVTSFRGYRALDLPGFAHHVLAFRAAGAAADRRATSDFSVGGVHGTAIELIPGVEIGGGARTFPVRGFAPSTQYGLAAASGTLEYRAPVASLLRGFRLLPLFFDRASVSLFGDAGSAWCDSRVGDSPLCNSVPTAPRWIASLGAELNLDAAVLHFDRQYRIRMGVAAPVSQRASSPSSATLYFAFGSNY